MKRLYEKFLKNPAQRTFLKIGAHSYSYADILKLSEASEPRAENPEAELFAKMIAADRDGLAFDVSKSESVVKKSRFDIIISTSGTEGVPKISGYLWSEIFSASSKSEELRGQTWLTCYDMRLFAGLNVLSQVLESAGTLVLVNSPFDVENLCALGKSVNACLTPTWLKNAIAFCDTKKFHFKRIILGGECVSQNLLDKLSSEFPSAKITHIYATTEAGVCFSVKDKREGFPLEFLKLDNTKLKIEIDRLFAKRGGEWVDTGDIVEVKADRVRFLGRAGKVAKVCGHRVSLLSIEQSVEELAEVVQTRAYFKESPISGMLPVMDVVLKSENLEPAATEKKIRDKVCAELGKYHIPRLINFVKTIPVGKSYKISEVGK